MNAQPATCPHRETTTHFEWACTLPAGHGTRSHWLRIAGTRQEDAA